MLIGASFNSIFTSPDLFETSVLAPGGSSDIPAAGVKTRQIGIVTRIFLWKCEEKKCFSAGNMDQEQYMFRPIAEDSTVAVQNEAMVDRTGQKSPEVKMSHKWTATSSL